MSFSEDLFKELSIRSEYEPDYSEKSTNLRIFLENAILSGNIKMIQKIDSDREQIKDLKLIFDEDLSIVKLYIASTITSFVSISIKNGLPKDVAEIAKKRYYAKIANCNNKEDLVHHYLKIVEELIEAMNRYSIKNYSLVVKMAIEYIHNNKFKFIYANDVSNAIKTNRCYLSKRFKDEVGQTITDYIHRVKMELAIELIESNIYKFNEISELLGYANYSYFSKVFKKFHSKTPNSYIKGI
ncbi:hypothetical protein LF65_01640 [Clostridium beijerinckii]|uniref:HTH araC/xylS-type domain-containing protein n=1 Tax=Clostridium beijerinckii TaxID=1520 RepID=A0A0B5QBE3_CLOBE|nr:helix-turn-helix domain-containing protein [Clostridium beijerinckii]AJG98245.1 hypothetical protein LF65_01640 [Clostridium beijerinckii]